MKKYIAFIIVSIVIILLTLILQISQPTIFIRFFGDLNPILLISGAILVSFIVLYIFKFEVYSKSVIGLIKSIGLAGIFGIIVIVFDNLIHLPKDINVPLPYSLLFYPVMGYFVQSIFQLLPLGILIFCTSWIKVLNDKNKYFLLIFIVSVIEAIYQAISLFSLNQYSIIVIVLIGLHVYIFNIIQLLLLKKNGYLFMYTFRLMYYLIWHIIWGTIRLNLLF